MSAVASAPSARRPRLQERRESYLDETIHSPGAVKINVQGAFIVDDAPTPDTPKGNESSHSSTLVRPTLKPDVPHLNGARHDTEDIRLPNHKAVVSHVALDVSLVRRIWNEKMRARWR